MQITWLPKQNPELLVLEVCFCSPAGELFKKATRTPSRRQLLGSLSRGACLRSCLLLGPQGCLLRMGVCYRYFKVLCWNRSSKTSRGTVFRTVSWWLEQPSAYLLHGTGLFPPTHTCFRGCRLPLGSIGCFLYFIQCMFHLKYRQRPRDKEQDLRY